jgi:leucyl/phenylalanyl-tRNA---protein transferase
MSLPISKTTRFPNPRDTDENGIVAMGGDLEIDTLIDAYSHGIFPWPHKGYPMLWFSPIDRGVLFFDDLHISRSLHKWLKKTQFKISFDKCFDEVMKNCATVKRSDQGDTWVTPQMMAAYGKLHRKGLAHSVECWSEGKLVGGLYGVNVAGVFSAESMFFYESGASKYCLLALIHRLHGKGHMWVDTQMVSSVVEAFGGKYIPREEYLKLLETTQKKKLSW